MFDDLGNEAQWALFNFENVYISNYYSCIPAVGPKPLQIAGNGQDHQKSSGFLAILFPGNRRAPQASSAKSPVRSENLCTGESMSVTQKQGPLQEALLNRNRPFPLVSLFARPASIPSRPLAPGDKNRLEIRYSLTAAVAFFAAGTMAGSGADMVLPHIHWDSLSRRPVRH